jgi:hypothetical protein
MRIFVGSVFILVGFFVWAGWETASHVGIDFDPGEPDNWFLLFLIILPTALGIRILFHPLFKKRKSRSDVNTKIKENNFLKGNKSK